MAGPRPPDEPWTDVLSEVERALDDLGVEGEDVKSALLDGVRQALDRVVQEGAVGGEELADAVPARPEVTLVEGGRSDANPPDDAVGAPSSGRPDLRVAERPAGEAHPPTASPPEVRTEVRVVRLGAGRGGSARGGGVSPSQEARPLRPSQDGSIRLEGTDGWQTVFRGEAARAYRIGCDAGFMQIALDGVPEERLGPGQSIDVEARLVRVGALADEGASGWYRRLPSNRG